ncbi:MAG TPA: hypothetical protein VGH20_20190 [Myxococcales bacterium]|jgi:hypothetical protein
MLGRSDNFLGSSRATFRRNVRKERMKALQGFVRAWRRTVGRAVSLVVGLVLLCGLPVLYLCAAYLAVDLPFRFLSGREHATWKSLLLLLGAFVVALVGLVRAVQGVPPVAPVRPRFARAMYALSWVAGILFTLSDFAH